MFNEFDNFLLYLRKSRMDTDYAETSVEETLSRHKAILLEFAKNNKLHIAEILEEVVSGESLHSRPKMIRLLELVNTGRYAGVICMDIERLSGGSSLESGYIMQVFQVNGFKIVTPGKIYDLRNESDEQFTDMRFMFSRYELKSITTRLVRGRNVSASEGKFMGSISPYGYELLPICQTLAVQCFRVLFIPDLRVTPRSKSLFRSLCPCAHFVVWVGVWVKPRIPTGSRKITKQIQ